MFTRYHETSHMKPKYVSFDHLSLRLNRGLFSLSATSVPITWSVSQVSCVYTLHELNLVDESMHGGEGSRPIFIPTTNM